MSASVDSVDRSFILWCVFCAFYVPLGVVYLIFGVSSRSKLIKLILKCVPILFLFFYVLVIVLPSTLEEQSSGDDKRAARTQAFLWGLAFSCIGDGSLVIPRLRPVGIISFAISICIYIAMFSLSSVPLFTLDVSLVLLSIPILLAVIFSLRFLLKSDMNKRVPPTLLFLACVYFCILALMLWASLLRMWRHGDRASVSGAFGALLFFVSDISIVASALWGAQMILFQGRVLIMSTYYGAQLFIALSL